MYEFWRKLVGDTYLSFDNSIYLSEKATADRNYCLGYMMQENRSFQQGKNPAIAKKIGRNWDQGSLVKNLELIFPDMFHQIRPFGYWFAGGNDGQRRHSTVDARKIVWLCQH